MTYDRKPMQHSVPLECWKSLAESQFISHLARRRTVALGPLVALRSKNFRRTVRYAYTFRRFVCDSIEWHLVSIGRHRCPPRRNSTLPHTTPCVPASEEHAWLLPTFDVDHTGQSNRVPVHGSISPLFTAILRILALVAHP
jgi:hypothetical protein